MDEPRCTKCEHYFITYDPGAPQGCRFFRFKSRHEPMRVVYEASGKTCPAYADKRKRARRSAK